MMGSSLNLDMNMAVPPGKLVVKVLSPLKSQSKLLEFQFFPGQLKMSKLMQLNSPGCLQILSYFWLIDD